MRERILLLRGVTFYWRSHAAVVLGVATAVAVLAGALLVGDSVRGSLRDLVVQRLGRTDLVVSSTRVFREQLAADISADETAGMRALATCPLVIAQGFVSDQATGRRAGRVRVYGVDDRFWRFHGLAGVAGPPDRDALVSPGLAARLRAGLGSTILVRVERPADVPLETLHGRRDDLSRTLRLTVRAVLPRASLGEFALEPQQADVLAVFVPLSRLQQAFDAPGRVNALLISAGAGNGPAAPRVEALVRRHAALEDLGFTVTAARAGDVFIVGSESGLLNAAQAEAAQQAAAAAGMESRPVLTYLANSLRVGDRSVPYSLVTALDLRTIDPAWSAPSDPGTDPPILLNEWAAADLRARAGDLVTLEYYAWEEPGRLATRTARFRVAAVVPIAAGAGDLAPAYRGISDSPALGDWNPPFPIDLRRIRPEDEQYWKRYRTMPKAFVPLETGQRLWGSRHGALTSIRVSTAPGQSIEQARFAYAGRLRAAVDPLAAGLAVRDVRADGLRASRGATDFGAYFTYFSFFLIASALLLAALFFKLGVEQRGREVGLLRAVGFGRADVRRLFLHEGLLLSVAGSAVGVGGALAYASVVMAGLRSWWVDAVGTTSLTLHVSAASLVAGAVGGTVAAGGCIWWTLRSLDRVSERSLLAGGIEPDRHPTQPPLPAPPGERKRLAAPIAVAALGLALLGSAAAGWMAPSGAFFGAGAALLCACLGLFLFVLRRTPRSTVIGGGWRALSRLGLRYATDRPGRSAVAVAVIASATFILVSVDAFRRDERLAGDGPRSGIGGYRLLVDTLLPVVDDPGAREGRTVLNLSDLDASVAIEPFRRLPGDDTSCLNLYEPTRPAILAPRDAFLAAGRFTFQASLASTDAERANPWLLLHRTEPDGAVPVVADANSLTYVLHRRLGDAIVIGTGARRIHLRLVAALHDSVFQGALLMSQANFQRLFPEQEGYRLLLVDVASARERETAARLEEALADFGAEVTPTRERMAQFHRVENTYLSTFQTLGGLGLLLGTVGVAAVLLRNVLERRRELALLAAVGYRRGHLLVMIGAETALLLGVGVGIGAACAALAIAPAVAQRGGRVPISVGGALLLFGVFTSGLVSAAVAARAATGAPLLHALRSE